MRRPQALSPAELATNPLIRAEDLRVAVDVHKVLNSPAGILRGAYENTTLLRQHLNEAIVAAQTAQGWREAGGMSEHNEKAIEVALRQMAMALEGLEDDLERLTDPQAPPVVWQQATQ